MDTEAKKTYRISIYGKKGCSKCAQLKNRLEKLTSTDWQDFGIAYNDILTEDGMVSFVKRECLNPQRIPSFIVEKLGSDGETYEAIKNPAHSQTVEGVRPMRLLGIQTDYTEAGKGIIPPAAVVEIMQQARGL